MGRASGEQGRIHPTAIVGEGVTLGADVGIGPFSIVADGAVIGDGCEIASHVRIEGCVRLGPRNRIFQGAVLGSPPQDLKYRGEPSILDIGADNMIREYATLNPGTAAGEVTRVGSGCLLMAYSHVAHNCAIGDGVILEAFKAEDSLTSGPSLDDLSLDPLSATPVSPQDETAPPATDDLNGLY